MKPKKQQFTLLASLLVAMLLLLITGCRDESGLKPNLQPFKIEEYGKTIPVDLQIEGNKAKVAFIISSIFYTLDLSENKRTKEIELLRNSIKNETPLRIFLKEKTSEIVKIETLSDEDATNFKKQFTQPTNERINSRLTSVIPNFNTLMSIFHTIKSEECTGSRNDSYPCISSRYMVDGCYARAHQAKRIINDLGYNCKKYFVYGNLTSKGRNNCCATWNFHVAPLVSYRNSAGVVMEMIVDPALNSIIPISVNTWKDLLRRPDCGPTYILVERVTAGNIYYKNISGRITWTDDDYISTTGVLNTFRDLSGCTPNPPPSVYAFTNFFFGTDW